jgi:hypothetical protein
VAVTPARLERIPSDVLPPEELKTGIRVTHVRSRDVAQHVWLATARSAWASPAETLEGKIGLFSVIPLHGKLFADELNVFGRKSHGNGA